MKPKKIELLDTLANPGKRGEFIRPGVFDETFIDWAVLVKEAEEERVTVKVLSYEKEVTKTEKEISEPMNKVAPKKTVARKKTVRR
jgi:hypothetical protein